MHSEPSIYSKPTLTNVHAKYANEESQRQPISIEIMVMAADLADRADNLGDKLSDKLSKVIIPYPQGVGGVELKDDSYPALWEEMRMHLRRIEEALNRSHYLIEKAEL